MEIVFRNTEDFAKELLQKVLDTGFNGMSKNDIYDYLLYLFDKYAEEGFLGAKSNFENAQYFKVTEQKIKNSKLNIALKYKEYDYLNVISNFLINLKPSLVRSVEGDSYELVIDDYYTKMCLEYELKKMGDTLDYRLNREKVLIKKNLLVALLNEYNEELAEKISNQEIFSSLKELVSTLLKIDDGGNIENLFRVLKEKGRIILKELRKKRWTEIEVQ